jgi:hypothetical protein
MQLGQELMNRWTLGSNRKLKSWNFSAAFLQPTNGHDGVGVNISVTLSDASAIESANVSVRKDATAILC